MSLKTRILLILGVGNLLGSILFSALTLHSHWESALRSLDVRLIRAAHAAAFVANPEFHERLLQEADEIPPEIALKKVRDLDDLAEKMVVRKITALVMRGDRVFMSAFSGNRESEASSPYRLRDHELHGVSEPLKSAFAGEQPLCVYGNPEEGPCRCVLLPRKTSSGEKFVIAVEFPMESVHERFQELIGQYALQAFVFFLIPFVLLSYFFGRAASHLQQLSRFTTTLIDRNFSPDPETIAGVENIAREHQDEIGTISASLARMHSALGKHIAELEQATASREKMESEMRIAGDIQRSILPKRFPPHFLTDRVEMFATLRPAQGVGGDFFDFSLPDPGHLLLLAGDVSGKGTSAALFMALTTAYLKACGQQGLSPEEILRSTNRHLSRSNELSMFATVFCGLVDLDDGTLRFAVAGHNPAIIIGEGGPGFLPAGGMALGLSDRPEFFVGTASLGGGETLLLYTDGVPEAMNTGREFFSEERMFEVIRRCGDRSPHRLVTALTNEVNGFSRGVPQADDIMMMAIRLPRRAGGAEETLPASFRMKNSFDGYPAMNRFFEEFWEANSLPSAFRHDCMVVIEEAVSNVIRHGFPGGGEHEIRLGAGIVGGSLILEFEDQGVPFNPKNHVQPPPDLAQGRGTQGGWGIFLIRKLVSEMLYRRDGDRNILRLRMDLPTETQPDNDMQGVETMEIQETIKDSIAVLKIAGRIDTQSGSTLEQALERVLDRGYLKILLDFSLVEYITSGGLRVLLHYSKMVQPLGGALIPAAMSPEVKKVFQLTGFLAILHHFATVEEAEAKLRAWPDGA